ncbi:MAG: hypothetical protein H7099_17625 [Gemmatimonadaceae bacterium]|nr:hypothetical protein [Gemmatimonadaceae bacterium]
MKEPFGDNRSRLGAALLGVGVVVLIGTACSLFTIGNDTSAPTSPPPRIDNTARIAAITATANGTTGLCADIRPFYWEIGDRLGSVAGGSVNRAGSATRYGAQTAMPIGAASQWMYAVYVATRRQAIPASEDIFALSLRSGYTSFSDVPCDPIESVADCGRRGSNGVATPSHFGRFFYGSGHAQRHAVEPPPGMNLGSFSRVTLGRELQRVLGTDIDLTYTTPQVADGIRTTPAAYALFLQKILGSRLRFGFLLGNNATCTNPATCATAISTPLGTELNWSYSLGHWVENDSALGDGAFSSPGALGFYPWINAAVDTYGIVARVDSAGGILASARCGALLRKSWFTAGMQ